MIEVRVDHRPGMGNPVLVIRIEPLRYAVISTDAGDMTAAFYYDVAPNTVDAFLRLSSEGYYDGLNFHRIVPDFVVQGGDPMGDGRGGPGYHLEAEFSDRKHKEGVLSMAQRRPARAANGAALSVRQQRRQPVLHLPGASPAPGQALHRVWQGGGWRECRTGTGQDATRRQPAQGKPKTLPVIKKIKIKAVTAAKNPYPELLKVETEK